MMDFRAHADEGSGGKGWGEQGLERKAMVDCDNEACGRTSQIMAIEKVTLVRLKRIV